MALQLTTAITTVQGFEVSDAYGRVSVVDNLTGTQLQASVEFYVSELQYLGGALALQLSGLNTITLTPYDRNTQGVDILSIGHDELITALGEQGVSATKILS